MSACAKSPRVSPANGEIRVVVELFGNARLLAGRNTVTLLLPPTASAVDVAERLGEAMPALVGEVVKPRGGLVESYVLNLNGLSFMSDRARLLRPGDRLLLFSSQAGG